MVSKKRRSCPFVLTANSETWPVGNHCKWSPIKYNCTCTSNNSVPLWHHNTQPKPLTKLRKIQHQAIKLAPESLNPSQVFQYKHIQFVFWLEVSFNASHGSSEDEMIIVWCRTLTVWHFRGCGCAPWGRSVPVPLSCARSGFCSWTSHCTKTETKHLT